MSDFILTDTFTNNNLTIKEDTFKVTVGGNEIKNVTDSSVTDGSLAYQFTTAPSKTGFVLKIGKKSGGSVDSSIVNQQVVVTYTTVYDVKDIDFGGNLTDYVNVGNLKWITDEKEYIASKKSTVKVNTNQEKKGYKDGSYNYETKTFSWKVALNYNFDTIDKAIFTDTLPDTQVIDKSSISVYHATLGTEAGTEGDKLEENEDYQLTYNNNTFTITFNNIIINPYIIKYTSKDADDVLPVTTGNTIIENKAMLVDANNKSYGSWEKTVKVHHTNYIIDKTHAQLTGTPKVTWSLDLNPSQSKLSNVVIEDTIGKDENGDPNQMVYKDSFKVYQVNYENDCADCDAKKIEAEVTGDTSLYEVKFDDIKEGNTFEIHFKKDITNAYIIKYDTFFLGANNASNENKVVLNYETSEEKKTADKTASFTMKFSGTASTSKGQLQLMKFDVDSKKPDGTYAKALEGAQFELWFGVPDNNNPNSVLIENGTTGTGGTLLFKTKVGQGDYYLKETVAPIGYDLSKSEYKNGKKVKIDATLKTLDDVTNELNKCEIIFINKDKDKNTITTGSKYIVKDKDGNLIKDASGNEINEKNPLTPSADGKIILPRLPAGDYTIEQIETPEGYYANDKPFNFTVDPEKCLSNQTFTNEKIPETACTDFTIIVKDEDGNLIKEKEVKIIDPVTKKEIGKGKTDTEGKITIPNTVKPGSYVVYENGKELGTVLVDFDGTCEATVKPACPLFVITVEQEGINAAEGTQLVIKDASGVTEIATSTVNNEGKVQFNELTLPSGTYTVFDKADTSLGTITVNYEDGPCSATVTFSPSCLVFTITVKQNDVEVDKDAEITLTNVNDSTIVVNGNTNDNGQIIIDKVDLPIGQYKVTDNKGKYLGTIDVLYAQGQCEAVVDLASNACPIFTLTIQDVNGNSREGVSFEIKDVTGKTTIATATTDSNGVATVRYTIEPGTYKVYEGATELGQITVTDCKATVKPQPPVTPPGPGGGGGSTPPPTETPDPETPVKPGEETQDPEQPVKPGEETPDPEQPVKPGEETQDPEQPVKPGEETPDPEQPVKPGEETPDPEQPVKPGEETPDPEQPVKPGEETPDPEKPGKPGEETPDPEKPGKPGEETTKPEKPTSPELDKVIEKIPSLPGVVPSTPVPGESPNTPGTTYEVPNISQIVEELTQDPTKLIQTYKELKEFIDMYNNLSPEEQAEIDKLIDMDLLKQLLSQLEKEVANINKQVNGNQEKLPQTDNANQTGMMLGGLLLVGMSLVLLRRKWASSSK